MRRLSGKAKALDFIQYVMRHSPHAQMHYWHGEWAVAYTGGACPKFTVYHNVRFDQVENSIFRRSVFNDMAVQCLVAYKLLDDAGREAFVPELWERCQRRRANRNIPFWSPLT